MDVIKQKLEELQQRRHAIYAWICTTEQYQELLQLDAIIGVLSELAEGFQNVPQNEDTLEEEVDAARSGV